MCMCSLSAAQAGIEAAAAAGRTARVRGSESHRRSTPEHRKYVMGGRGMGRAMVCDAACSALTLVSLSVVCCSAEPNEPSAAMVVPTGDAASARHPASTASARKVTQMTKPGVSPLPSKAKSSAAPPVDAAFIPPTPAAAAAVPTAATRPPPPPPDPKLNGPDDYKALIPITIITLMTIIVLALCAPGTQQWSPPVSSAGPFLSFEWPGRSVTGGYLASSDAVGGGPVTYAARMGTGGVTAGTRPYWPVVGRRSAVRSIGAALTAHGHAVLVGPPASGRSTLVAHFVDSTRGDNDANATRATGATNGKRPTDDGVTTSQPYNVVLWLDASSPTALARQFAELHAYLRLHSMDHSTASMIVGVHAWLRDQDRWLVVFDNCLIARSSLGAYAPGGTRGGHTLVVLHDDSTETARQLGFDMSAPEVVRVGGLASVAGGSLVASVSNSHDLDSQPARRALRDALGDHTGAIVLASLFAKRRTKSLSTAQLVERIAAARGSGSKVSSAGQTILGLVLADAAQTHGPALDAFINIARIVVPSGSVSVPRALILSLMASDDEESSDADSRLDALLRDLAGLGLVAEHASRLCSTTTTQLFLPAWVVGELRLSAARAVAAGSSLAQVGSSYSFEARSPPAGWWRRVRDLMIDADGHEATESALAPLVHALAASSASGYVLPAETRPHEQYLSAMAAAAEDATASPLRDVPASVMIAHLLEAYGESSSLGSSPQDARSCEVARAWSLIPAATSLLEFDPPAPSSDADAEYDIALIVGAFRVDIAHEPLDALAALRRALFLASRAAASPHRRARAMPNPLIGRLEGKSDLSSHTSTMTANPVLTTPTLPVDARVAAALAAMGVAHLHVRPAAAEPPTEAESRRTLDLALNYQRLALELRKQLYGAEAAARETKEGAEGVEVLHPALSSSLSQVAHVFTLQGDIEAARSVYATVLRQDTVMSLAPLDADTRDAALRGMTTGNWSRPSYGVAASPGAFDPTATRSHWDRLMRHMRFTRDVSLLAYAESMISPSSSSAANPGSDETPSQTLHARAYRLEVSLFGESSVAAAARWLHLGHASAARRAVSIANEYYSSALAQHESALPGRSSAATDLRIGLAAFHAARGLIGMSRGRAARRQLERAIDVLESGLGGATHPALIAPLEILADTCAKLALHEDALGTARTILTIQQAIGGDAAEPTRVAKARVIAAYQAMQQANEAHQRRQEQLRREIEAKRRQEEQAQRAQTQQPQQQQSAPPQQRRHPPQQRGQQQPAAARPIDDRDAL